VSKPKICGTDFILPTTLNGLVTWPEKAFELKQILLLNKEEDFFKFVNNVRFKQHRTTESVTIFYWSTHLKACSASQWEISMEQEK
jgi:hypothetical protein